MHNYGLKNFICSFILSMLAIVCADKIVLHAPQNVFKETPHKYVRAPEISLFADSVKTPEKTEETEETPALIFAQEKQADEEKVLEVAEDEISLPNVGLLPPPPENKPFDLAQAHAIVLNDEPLSDSPVIYDGAPEDEDKIIPLEQGEQVTHQSIESSDFAALAPLNWLSEPVYHSNLEEDTDQSLAAQSKEKEPQSKTLEEIMNDPDSPWIVASANRFAKNQMAVQTYAERKKPEVEATEEESKVEEKTEEKPEEKTEAESALEEEALPVQDISQVEETFKPKLLQKPDEASQTAYKMIQNLLIPIPEEIMNDADLTPQLSYSPNEEKEKTVASAPSEPNEEETTEEEKDSGLFKSISSWFSKKEKEDTAETKTAEEKDSTQQKQASGSKKGSKKLVGNRRNDLIVPPESETPNAQIIPAELRLAFQPNRAEVSGQSLQWIRAFADNARDHDDVFLEVRIDTTGPLNLQKKRLKLLSKIFADRGVDFRKINVIATSREPNSLIIRNIRLKAETFEEPEDDSFAVKAKTYY